MNVVKELHEDIARFNLKDLDLTVVNLTVERSEEKNERSHKEARK